MEYYKEMARQKQAELQDQRAALQWVRRNAEHIGADPSRVLLFGQSAGSGSTSVHLLAPRSAGLFSSAALESKTSASASGEQDRERVVGVRTL